MTLPPPLNTLSAREQETLGEYVESVRFEEDDAILRAGDPGDSFFILDEGTVRIELDDVEVDTEAVIAYLEPGAILGELSLLDRKPRSANAFADTAVAARQLTAAGLDGLADAHPRIAMSVLHALGRDASRKLRKTTHRLGDFLVEDEPIEEVDEIVERARSAQRAIADWDEERIDGLLQAIAGAIGEQATELAAETVRETRIGDVSDKAFKNYVAALGIHGSLAGRPGRGPVRTDDDRRVTEIASPAGVVFGIVPMTNPVATAVFKTLIALKGRNALILSFHRSALGTGNRTGEVIHGALEQAGAPTDLVQWIRKRTSRRKTRALMSHPDVSLILATGGSSLVRAAYSSGTPALGVGPGNAPAWVREDADIDAAAEAVVESKAFDHGLICGAEHNLVVDRAVRDAFVSALERRGAAVLDDDETERLLGKVVRGRPGRFTPRIIGRPAETTAAAVGIARDHAIRVIVVPTDDPSAGNPLAGEKIAPLLSLFTVDDREQGMELCRRLLEQDGTGHTAIIHSTDDELIDRFGMAMPASRILVNSPGSHGVVGLTSGLVPSFTLGCGTFGNNSTTDNVSYTNLLNIKRLARFTEPGPEAVELEKAARAEAARLEADEKVPT